MNKLVLIAASCGVLALGVGCSKSSDADAPNSAARPQTKVVASSDKQGTCTQEVINDFEDLKTYLNVRHESDSWKATANQHCGFFNTKYGNQVNCVTLPPLDTSLINEQISSQMVKRICENATFDSPVVFE